MATVVTYGRKVAVAATAAVMMAALTLQPAWAAPANDDFASATVISGISGSSSGTNVDATAETGEPTFLDGVSVWYKWTAPEGEVVDFCTPADYDTKVGVYTGSAVNALTPLQENDDYHGLAPDGLGSAVRFDATNATTYYVGVGGYSGATGNFTLQWALDCTPPYMTSFKTKVKGPNVTVSWSTLDLDQNGDFTFQCQVDAGGWDTCSEPVTFTAASGNHHIDVQAFDLSDIGSPIVGTDFLVHSKKYG